MIEIINYQPRWAAEFEALRSALAQATGRLALRIDHIGSTAVPELAAKDIIDIQLTVATLDGATEQALAEAVAPIGFERTRYTQDHAPGGYDHAPQDWRKLYFRQHAPRRVHLHVRAAGAANQRYALLFRDYLRATPPAALAYASLKRRLAEHLRSMDDYSDVKDPACDLIAIAAEAWALQNGWSTPA